MKLPKTGHSNPDAKTSVLWLRYLLDAIGKTGVDGLDTAARVGLDPAILQDTDAWLGDEYTAMLLMLAAEHSRDPDYGLTAGGHFVPSAFGPLGYSMMTSPDLRSALERSTQFTRSVTEATRTRLACSEKSGLLEVLMPSFNPETGRLVDEFMMLSILSSFRWLVGRELVPSEIEFMHAEPACVRKHIAAFGRKPKFGSHRCAFLFSREQLDWPLRFADASMAQIHDRHAAEMRSHAAPLSISPQVRRVIQQKISVGEPTLTEIAELMNMSERTLQRRLKDEQLTFHQLVDEVRQSLLDGYLLNSSLSLKEIAALLGFADQSCFTRAVQRWYGRSPKAVRLALAGSGLTP